MMYIQGISATSYPFLIRIKILLIKIQAAFSNEVTTNYKTYRECSQHVIYCVTKSSRSSLYSLADRGVNGGLAGSYVRVIETHPDLKVYIRGIDNHQISSIPIATVVELTKTTTGEVIVIVHQHEHYGKNKAIYYYP